MHTSGEQHVQTLEEHRGRGPTAGDGHLFAIRQQPGDLGLPQREAGARADMATALTSLEDELAGTGGEEPAEQTRRGHVQEGVDAGGFQGRRLGRAPAGDQRAGRADLADGLDLSRTDLRRGEAEDPDAPWGIPEQGPRLFQQGTDLVAAHQGQGEKRQATGVGHRLGELGPVTDPRHGSLRDRETQTPVGGKGRARGKRGKPNRGRKLALDSVPNRRDDAAGGDVPVGQRGREGAVLTDRQKLFAQVTGTETVCDSILVQLLAVELGNRQIGPDIHAMPGQDRGLAAVHAPDGGSDLGRQLHLPDKCELDVQHDADRPRGNSGRGGVRPHSTGGPHRPVQVTGCEQMLEQGERGQGADPAAGLASPGDQTVGTGRDRRPGLGNRGDLDEDAPAPGRGCGLDIPAPVGRPGIPDRLRLTDRHGLSRQYGLPDRGRRPGREDDGVHLGRQFPRPGRATGGHPHPERASRPASRVRERNARNGGVTSQVENTEPAGSDHSGDQPRIRLGEGSDGNDEVPQ